MDGDHGSLTERLAAALNRARAAGIDDATRATAERFVLDTLACAMAGTLTPPGRTLLAEGRRRGHGPAGVLALDDGRDDETAALVNGGLAHIVEMDDLDRASVVHPGCVVVPAALAVAEATGASGAAFLDAVVVGYEAAVRVGESVGRSHYAQFHNTATCGPYGSASAAAALLGLDDERTVWALGNAGSVAGGLWQFNRDGAMTKHLHAGRAAANGVLAARLAADGFTGAREVLEGAQGLFAGTSTDARPERVAAGLDGLGGATPWRIHGVSVKPHASCRHTHPAVDAALALRRELGGEVVAAARSVTVETYGAALAVTDTPDPRNPYQAKFSLQYTVAQALVGGRVGLGDFGPDRLDDPGLRAVMGRVGLRVDPGIDARYPGGWGARVRVGLADGRERTAQVDAPVGDPEVPVDDAAMLAKVADLLDGTRWAGRAAAIAGEVAGLDRRASMAGWLAGLQRA